MFTLASVAILAVLVSDSSQRLFEPMKKPYPLNQVLTNIMKGWPCDDTNTKCWTRWFDRDDPTGSGDWETLNHLRKQYPEGICPNPVDIEVLTLSGSTLAETGDVIFKFGPSGFVCENKNQLDKKCEDYKVRFSCYPPFCGDGVCWTNWYDQDNPSGTGDWETLEDLRASYPGKICADPLYIQAVTTETSAPASSTGDYFLVLNPSEGLVCRNEDQTTEKCSDYKVRFGCPCKP